MTVHHKEEARRAMRAIVNAAPGFDVVGEAASAEEALELAVAIRPDLALVGLGMPGIDGFDTSRRLLAALPDSTVVLLSGSTAPNGDALAASRATATIHADALTPAALQAVWDERHSG